MSTTLFEPQEGSQQNSNNAEPTQNQQTPQAQEPNVSQTPAAPDLFADQLSSIKDAEGRQKYADVSAALGSIPHAQGHISNLEGQVAQLQEELNKRQGMEQVLERIQQQNETSTEQPSVEGLDAAQIGELFNQFSSQREQAQQALDNEIAFSNTLKEQYGDKAQEVVANKANELGISVGFLQGVVQKSPKAALAYFTSGTPQVTQPTVPSNNVNALTPPATPDAVAEAKAKLFGQRNTLIDKWRQAASN